MGEPNLSSPAEAVPGTPGIKEIRTETGSEGLKYGPGHGLGPGESPSPRFGIRKVSLRAEIDTSPPFGSVMEAVTRFGGHGPWINPLYKFGDNYNGDEEFDIKRVEEQTAELEKDLIVKELETLDVLEELTTTKRIVEELKRQLQEEALKCMAIDQAQHNMPSPHIKEITTNKQDMNSPSPNCPTSSPDLILMELKRAKLNLGKTITDLGVIQNSVECLTKKMRKEKHFIEKTREKLTSKFAGALKPDQEDQLDHDHPSSKPDEAAAVSCMKKTAEMRWVAAKKMGEAAKAAEAVAMAEITALSSGENQAEFLLSEPDKMSFNFRVQTEPTGAAGWSKKRLALADAMLRIDEAHATKIAIMRKLREASEEVKLSKRAMEEAMSRVEAASKKQLAAEEAVSKWMTVRPAAEDRPPRRHAPIIYSESPRIDAFSQLADRRHVDYRHVGSDENVGVGAKPVLKTTVSMRDVLSKKQVASDVHRVNEDLNLHNYGGAARREIRSSGETHKVALSDMLQALRDDLNFPSKAEKDHHVNAGNDVNHHNVNPSHNHHQKQFWTQRKKFGFIQISLPLTRPGKKKTQSL